MSTPNAPRTRAQQFGFLRVAHHGPLTWHALCLSLARQAPGLPGVYPSARAAMDATPAKRRHPLIKATRGMVGYFSDPNDSNPFDHVATVAGWDGCDPCWNGAPDDDPAHDHSGDLHDLFFWSNDIIRDGGVDLVRGDRFPDAWGDPFRFASDWLNGYDLPRYDVDKPTLAHGRGGTLGENYRHAIADVRKALRYHREHNHPKVVAVLADDLARMKAHAAKFS